MSDQAAGPNMVELATELTIAWLTNASNRASADDVPAFLQRMHDTLKALENGGQAEASAPADRGPVPAVSVRKSLSSRDQIISMIDGKPYKSLKRHLSRHGLTPDQYRERYGLKPDYPMIAPGYAEQRRELAIRIGLGSKARAARTGKRGEPSEPAPARAKPARPPRAAKRS